MNAEDNPLNIRDREPKQGERFTEPKLGGLYPLAAAGAAIVVLFCAAVILV